MLAITASRLSNGSPIPMKTILVSFRNSGTLRIWFNISSVERFARKPCRPVMQKRQPMRHPACVEMHSV